MIPDSFIPYSRQTIDEDDIEAVVNILRSNFLTSGPAVERFEHSICEFTGSSDAAAVSNGTAALHCALAALRLNPEDEVIVPSLTFAATANAVLYAGARPVFADVEKETLLIDPLSVERQITKNTKAVIGVDYAGQPCDWDVLNQLSDRFGFHLIADACHSLGATYKEKKVGTLAEMTALSFHPVKPITTGEGGMVLSDNPELIQFIKRFRNHGISADAATRRTQMSFHYEMNTLGYNYRITDIQSALGWSQLKKLSTFIKERQRVANRYNRLLKKVPYIRPLKVQENVSHGYTFLWFE